MIVHIYDCSLNNLIRLMEGRGFIELNLNSNDDVLLARSFCSRKFFASFSRYWKIFYFQNL